jgi:hypothetical protein
MAAETYVTLSELPEFKEAYEKAQEDQEISFEWKGERMLVHFAKYVIEYFENEQSTR